MPHRMRHVASAETLPECLLADAPANVAGDIPTVVPLLCLCAAGVPLFNCMCRLLCEKVSEGLMLLAFATRRLHVCTYASSTWCMDMPGAAVFTFSIHCIRRELLAAVHMWTARCSAAVIQCIDAALPHEASICHNRA